MNEDVMPTGRRLDSPTVDDWIQKNEFLFGFWMINRCKDRIPRTKKKQIFSYYIIMSLFHYILIKNECQVIV